MENAATLFTDPSLLSMMSKLQKQIQLHPFSTTDEKVTQKELAVFLTEKDYTFEREYRLSKEDIPDFLIRKDGWNVVLEVKLRARRMRIFHQLSRYAKHDSVHGLLLLTGTSMKVPTKIEQKPSFPVSLGQGWL